jgi:hypothetical protein
MRPPDQNLRDPPRQKAPRRRPAPNARHHHILHCCCASAISSMISLKAMLWAVVVASRPSHPLAMPRKAMLLRKSSDRLLLKTSMRSTQQAMIGTCTISLRVGGLADEGAWLGLGCRSAYQSEYLALGSHRWAWERTSRADCTHGLPLRF